MQGMHVHKHGFHVMLQKNLSAAKNGKYISHAYSDCMQLVGNIGAWCIVCIVP